ncbi:MAG: 16S rRNA (adenine(1518)-N(6)/adenine(1519)-N(6))-dimethyltransferase RsmA [Clostridia bacterium]|nr:16S rRNA (adenine(1518)-N(6)/adenine(1519)-N(6))-dimethyltransferase RsmA [Clostridia bacterium]
MSLNLCDPKTVRQLMSTFGLTFRREFGQNFLVSHQVLEDIADSCSESSGCTVLEIGPGIGALTAELAKRYETVVALEIDKGLIPLLSFTMDSFQNVRIIQADALKTDLAALLAPYFEKGPVSVCANLPYYITTPILMKLLESNLPFETVTVMIQSEVADRLLAAPGSSDCGAITTVVSYYGTVERLFRIGPENFLPPPNVESSVIRFRPYLEKPNRPLDEPTFFRTVKAAFEQRRKTLPNALSASFKELSKETCQEAVVKAGFKPDIRGEKLDVKQFTILSDILYEELQKQ